MIINDADDFNDLMEELKSLKLRQATLDKEEALCREQVLKIMKTNDTQKEDTIHGAVRLQQRATKQYSNIIQLMEKELKETKKLADDLGDYKVSSYKESLVYVSPKEEKGKEDELF